MSIHLQKSNSQKIGGIPGSLKKNREQLSPSSLVGSGLFRFQKGYLELVRFAHQLLFRSFKTMGFLDHPKPEGLSPTLLRLYHAALRLLERSSREREQHPPLTLQQQDRLAREYPETRAHFQLLVHCIQHYPEVFSGELTATEVMFPKSSLKKVAGIYKGNPVSDYFNDLAAHSTLTYVKERSKSLKKGEKIRILEIGAGTGGTSGPVLEAIEGYGDRLEYVYTDISSFFLQHGRSHFEDCYPFLAFDILDISKDPHDQEFQTDSFELILATNVLHATPNIKTTLRHIQMLLKNHGWMILNEMTKAQDVLTLTFGLLDGWWLFEDENHRIQDSPLLSAKTWQQLFREEGFQQVEILEPDQSTALDLSQNIIVAEKGRFSVLGSGENRLNPKNQRTRIFGTPPDSTPIEGEKSKYRHCLHYGFEEHGAWISNQAITQQYKITLDGNPCIRDHRVFGQHMMPPAAYLEMVYIGTRKLLGFTRGLQVEGVYLRRHMIGLSGVPLDVRLTLIPSKPNNHFEIQSKKASGSEDAFQIHVHGNFRETAEPAPETLESRSAWNPLEKILGPSDIYSAETILKAGPSYQTIEQLQIQDQRVISRLKRSSEGENYRDRFVLEPSIVDGLFATGSFLAQKLCGRQGRFFRPVSFDRIMIYAELNDDHYDGVATCVSAQDDHINLNLMLFDQQGNQVLSVQGCHLQRILAENLYRDSFYRVLFWR